MDTKHGESLSDFVRRVRSEKRLSLTDVEANSARRGEKIAGSYVSRIENGVAESEGVTPKKLIALAYGLDVSLFDVLVVAFGQALVSDKTFVAEREKLWEMYVDVPKQCQRDVMDLLGVLQRNHSLSRARERVAGHRDKIRRREAAAHSPSAEGPARVADTLHPPGWETQGREGEEPILPAARENKRQVS